MPNFDLVVFDLDGTVFARADRQELTPRVLRTFELAHAGGVRLAVASGRPVAMMGETLRRAPWLSWYICLNGSCVREAPDVPAARVLASSVIPRARVLRAIDLIGEDRAIWSLFLPSGAYFDLGLMRQLGEKDARAGTQDGGPSVLGSVLETAAAARPAVTPVPSVRAALVERDEDAYKFSCRFSDRAEMERARDLLAELGGFEAAEVDVCELEVTEAGVSKGAALGTLCRAAGIDERRAVAFGDSGNDITFADSPATFVAMGNAAAAIKRAADDRCPSVTEDGVASWLEANLGL